LVRLAQYMYHIWIAVSWYCCTFPKSLFYLWPRWEGAVWSSNEVREEFTTWVLGKEWPTNGILTDCVDCCILAVAQTSDIIYFETLDLPLPELQGLKTLKIAFHNSKTEEVCTNYLIC
jgi:hypothetical protein